LLEAYRGQKPIGEEDWNKRFAPYFPDVKIEGPYEADDDDEAMFKKIKIAFAALALAVVATGCAITLPVNATSNPVGSKVGTAKATGFLGILFFDADASIRTAAKNGGITKISTVDIKHTSLLNIIVTYETIVTGE
jgi:hypothetical protein